MNCGWTSQGESVSGWVRSKVEAYSVNWSSNIDDIT
nr:MAG TPA: hypothetical protein [Caudoviricetes sp.]